MPMTPEEQISYKRLLDDLSFAKANQWRLTSVTLALFVGVFSFAKGANLDADQKHLLSILIISGAALCVYLLVGTQCDMGATRKALNDISERFFKDNRVFGSFYENPYCRGIEYLLGFTLVVFCSGAFVA